MSLLFKQYFFHSVFGKITNPSMAEKLTLAGADDILDVSTSSSATHSSKLLALWMETHWMAPSLQRVLILLLICHYYCFGTHQMKAFIGSQKLKINGIQRSFDLGAFSEAQKDKIRIEEEVINMRHNRDSTIRKIFEVFLFIKIISQFVNHKYIIFKKQ